LARCPFHRLIEHGGRYATDRFLNLTTPQFAAAVYFGAVGTLGNLKVESIVFLFYLVGYTKDFGPLFGYSVQNNLHTLGAAAELEGGAIQGRTGT
jgi:hypothetical protein